MPSTEIVAACETLKNAINDHRNDPEVRAFYRCIAPTILEATTGNLPTSLEWSDIPCGRYFTEGTLQRLPDLEDAFAEFRIALTGGMPADIRAFLEGGAD